MQRVPVAEERDPGVPVPAQVLGRGPGAAVVVAEHGVGIQVPRRAVDEHERDGRLDGYHYLPATKADLLRRLDRREEAADAYRRAIEWCDNEPKRAFLTARLTATLA